MKISFSPIDWAFSGGVKVLEAPLDSQPYDERDWWSGCVS